MVIKSAMQTITITGVRSLRVESKLLICFVFAGEKKDVAKVKARRPNVALSKNAGRLELQVQVLNYWAEVFCKAFCLNSEGVCLFNFLKMALKAALELNPLS